MKPILKTHEPPWLVIARNEIGVCSYAPGLCNPRITEYHSGTTIHGYDDKVQWCSTFLNWTLEQAGIPGTKSALARSWLNWGIQIERPVVGCIAVLWRESPDSWKGHVGFYIKEEVDSMVLLGGNQLNAVREHSYPENLLLSYRWPLNTELFGSNAA